MRVRQVDPRVPPRRPGRAYQTAHAGHLITRHLRHSSVEGCLLTAKVEEWLRRSSLGSNRWTSDS